MYKDKPYEAPVAISTPTTPPSADSTPDGHLKFPHLWPPQIPPGGYRLQAAEFDTLSFARTCDW